MACLGALVDGEVVDHGREDVLVPMGIEAALKTSALADAHPAENGMVLGHVTDAAAGGGRQGGAVVAEDRYRPARRFQQAEHHPYGGGLARPIATQECENAAARHADGHVEQRAFVAE